MLDQSTSISDHSTCCTADMRVNFEDLLDRLRHDKGRVESTLNCQHYSLSALDSNGRWAELNEVLMYLDSLDGVLDLEDPSLRWEGVDTSIVVASESFTAYLELNMFDIAHYFKNYLNIIGQDSLNTQTWYS